MKIHIWKIAVLFSVFLIALSFTGSKVRAAEISTIDIKINMKWDDEEDLDGSRPEEVTVTRSGDLLPYARMKTGKEHL